MKKDSNFLRNTKNFFAVLVTLLIAAVCFYAAGLPKAGENPHHFVIFGEENRVTLDNITRIDDNGELYYCNYTADYYSTECQTIMRVVKLVRETGCSVFSVNDGDNNALTCRNYDFPHLDDEGNITGANVVVVTSPENGYKSIAVADASACIEAGLPYYTGTLDDGETDTSILMLLPWICVDGMNEKGLTVGVLSVDVKDGEKPVNQNTDGLEKVLVTQLGRYILDSCATTEEAAQLAKSKNVVNTKGEDFQLFVSDAAGKSVLLEWRDNTLYVVETDAATNFYQMSNDAEDCYYPEGLKEKWTSPAQTAKEYNYGYGHGYERFKTIVTALDGTVNMSIEDAKELLASVKQTYDGALASDTRYSAIYDKTNLTLKLWLASDSSKQYDFSFASEFGN